MTNRKTVPQREALKTTSKPPTTNETITLHSKATNKVPTSAPTKSSGEPVSQGHAFIYSNFEEQTNGAKNLWQFEMWAKLFDIKVAEPFAVDSMFGLKGALPNISQSL